MGDPLDPRAEHVERRLRIAARVVLYPMALGLIAVAWQQYHGDPPRANTTHVVQWNGATGQGQGFRGRTAEGVLTGFDTQILERCSDGSVFTHRWYPGQRRFVQRGENLRGRQASNGREGSGQTWVVSNWVWARIGDHPRGTIRGQVSWTTVHGTVRCDSGPVRFALHRSP